MAVSCSSAAARRRHLIGATCYDGIHDDLAVACDDVCVDDGETLADAIENGGEELRWSVLTRQACFSVPWRSHLLDQRLHSGHSALPLLIGELSCSSAHS